MSSPAWWWGEGWWQSIGCTSLSQRTSSSQTVSCLRLTRLEPPRAVRSWIGKTADRLFACVSSLNVAAKLLLFLRKMRWFCTWECCIFVPLNGSCLSKLTGNQTVVFSILAAEPRKIIWFYLFHLCFPYYFCALKSHMYNFKSNKMDILKWSSTTRMLI